MLFMLWKCFKKKSLPYWSSSIATDCGEFSERFLKLTSVSAKKFFASITISGCVEWG